jgi:PAS domain S-box-containing protein
LADARREDDAPVSQGPRRIVASLRFKVTAAVLVVLAVAMAGVSALQYHWLRYEMVERVGVSAAPLGDVIKGSLRHAMLTRDRTQFEAILDNVGRQEGVLRVFVVDKAGEIRASSAKEDIGRHVALAEPTCQICHAVAAESRARTVVFASASGARVFRNVNPIVNEPACVACHDPRQAMNGVLITDFSMTEVDREVAGRLRQMLLTAAVAVGVTGLAIVLLMSRLVIDKVERLGHALARLGGGRLDVALPARSRDELGALEASFNATVERLRRANEVRERQELLENVLNHVDDAVAVYAADGTVLAVNRAGERAFGVASRDILGSRSPLLGDAHDDLLARAAADGRLTTELTLTATDGRAFPARLHVVPLRVETGALLASVVIVHDLTAERLRDDLHRQLAQSEKLAAVGRLAAGVAHELNNPLGNVLLYAKLLLEDGAAPDVRESNSRRIVDNALRCKAIVRTLLDYARPSQFEPAAVDLNGVARAAVASVAADLEARGVTCELRLAPAIPPVSCDARQMQQVVINLLQNGIDAVAAGGHLTVTTRPAGDGDGVVVAVEDDGPGLAPETASRVFEPFYTTKERGTGLGLSICYGIVERHHGRIWVESRRDDGGGTTFFVSLPGGGERR